jgi:hypothetical protein
MSIRKTAITSDCPSANVAAAKEAFLRRHFVLADHAFNYWGDLIKDTVPISNATVKDRVIAFFDLHLK